MPGPTPTQRIEELRRDLDKLSALVEKQDAVNTVAQRTAGEQIAELKDAVLRFQDKFTDFLKTSVDQDGRIKALEKGSDRRWQLVPILLSAAALLVSSLFGVANIIIALRK